MSSANLMVATVVPGRTRTVGSAHRLRLALATWMGSTSALVKYDVYFMTSIKLSTLMFTFCKALVHVVRTGSVMETTTISLAITTMATAAWS